MSADDTTEQHLQYILESTNWGLVGYLPCPSLTHCGITPYINPLTMDLEHLAIAT
jgi:hypothetical protein